MCLASATGEQKTPSIASSKSKTVDPFALDDESASGASTFVVAASPRGPLFLKRWEAGDFSEGREEGTHASQASTSEATEVQRWDNSSCRRPPNPTKLLSVLLNVIPVGSRAFRDPRECGEVSRSDVRVISATSNSASPVVESNYYPKLPWMKP